MLAPFKIVRAQSSKLKIGVLLPKSGLQGVIGQSCQKGADLAPVVLKERLGVDLELMNTDTETNVDTARTRAERLIEEGAHCLVGPFDSGAAAAIAQVAEQRGVPFIVNIAAAPPITESGYKFIVRNFPTAPMLISGAFDSGQTIAIAQVAEQRGIPFIVNIAAAPQLTEQGYKFVVRNFPTAPMLITGAFDLHKQIFKASGTTPKTAVMMSINDTFGTSMVAGIKAMFPKLGMPYELVDIITYDPAAKDLSVEVAKAKATKADMLMPVCRLNDAKLMIQELVKQRWEPMGVMNPGSPGLYEQDFLKTMGKYGEFHISNVPWLDPKSPMTASLEKRHAAKFANDQLDINGGFTFEALLVAAQAFLDAKSTKADALMDALRKIKIDQHVIIGGPIQFDAKGQNVNIKAAAVQNLKRKPTVVMPQASAAAPLVWPMPGWNDKRRT